MWNCRSWHSNDTPEHNTARYDSLKTSFEARLASLADTVRCAVEGIHQDQVLRQLNASASTREFAPAHARALIKRHLASERDAFFHGLAIQLADAEAEVTRCTRRNEELESSLSVLRGEATREERSRIEVTSVNADIQELRREYQVHLRLFYHVSHTLAIPHIYLG